MNRKDRCFFFTTISFAKRRSWWCNNMDRLTRMNHLDASLVESIDYNGSRAEIEPETNNRLCVCWSRCWLEHCRTENEFDDLGFICSLRGKVWRRMLMTGIFSPRHSHLWVKLPPILESTLSLWITEQTSKTILSKEEVRRKTKLEGNFSK